MPVDFMKRPAGQGGGNGNAQGNANPKVVVNPDISMVNFGRIADQANQTYDPEMAKYYAAVDLARQKFSGNEEADEKMFRKEIDDIYKNKLGGTLNPDTDIRGNNALSLAVRGLNEGYDDFLTFSGGAVDNAWDAVAGGIADATGQHKAAEKLRNLMDDRDVGTAIDIGLDLGLSALPFGMPAVVAKNLIQQSDNIDEAIKGRDNVTLEDLTGAQRAARGGEAALNTALAALPGAGRAAKVLRGAKEANVAKEIEKATAENKEALALLEKRLKEAEPKVTETQGKIDKANELIGRRAAADEAYKKAAVAEDPAKYLDLFDEASELNAKAPGPKLVEKLQRSNTDREKAIEEGILGSDEITAAQAGLDETASEVARLQDLQNKNYLQRAIANELAAARNVRSSITGIPEYTRGIDDMSKRIADELGINAEKLPRTNRGMRKLLREEPERFGIEVPEGKTLDDVISPRNQRMQANLEAQIIREQLGRTNIGGAIKNAMRGVGESANPVNYSRKLIDEDTAKLLDRIKADEKIKGTPTEKLKNIRDMVASSLTGVGALGVQGGLAGMATGDYDNLQQGFMATFNNLEQHPWKFLPGLFPIGAKRASMRMNPGLRGNMGSTVPFNAARAAAIGNYITSQTEPDMSEATNEEEILRRLAALKAGE